MMATDGPMLIVAIDAYPKTKRRITPIGMDSRPTA
jgi:hypothetical protein